ncbi:MAG: hypothetical protein GX567_06825 [Clostridia bacterium]|nr:hypothetical protein [Clostridia bacterium]
MSCRVLKRGMEEFILDTIVNTAKDAGYEKVIGEYIETPKNAMVKDLYQRLGFIPQGENVYMTNVSEYRFHKTMITKETEE